MTTSRRKSEAAGRWLGRVCRSVMLHRADAARWLVAKGLSHIVADAIAWLVILLLVFGLLSIAPIFLVLVAAAVVLAGAWKADERAGQDWFPKPTDHRDEPFYHPMSYNDDADPRFEDK